MKRIVFVNATDKAICGNDFAQVIEKFIGGECLVIFTTGMDEMLKIYKIE